MTTGALAVESEAGTILRFPDGLFGFPECHTFSLTRDGDDGLWWLQSTEHEALGFVLADPFAIFPDYTVDLSELDVARLRPVGAGDIAILVILTVGATPDAPCSANLQGPIAFNVHTGVARQVIQANRPTRAIIS
jgi:flagellar assembly factor FliW